MPNTFCDFIKSRAGHHFISHDLAVVKNLADRVLVLYQGQIMESGTVKEIFAPPFHPYTYSLIQAGRQLINKGYESILKQHFQTKDCISFDLIEEYAKESSDINYDNKVL